MFLKQLYTHYHIKYIKNNSTLTDTYNASKPIIHSLTHAMFFKTVLHSLTITMFLEQLYTH